MTSPTKLNEYNHAENPARELLEKLGWTYVPREALAPERRDEREVLLKGRLRSALMRLNQWMTAEQAERVIFDLGNVDATGMGRNQRVHEYLTYGMPITVDAARGRETRTVRFFDFDQPESGLNEFVVTTQFRVRRVNERGGPEDDERMVIPDLVLFVNGIPLVVMEAKAPTLMDEWKSRAVRQLRRYQEAGPGVVRQRRARAVPLQPAVHRPLRSGSGLRGARSAGERVLRVEVDVAIFDRRGPSAVRPGAGRTGAAHRRPAVASHAAGRATRLRGVRA